MDEIDPDALEQMKTRSKPEHRWAVYENKDLGSPNVGHLQFLFIGPEATYKEPPERMPDTNTINWRYLFSGWVDLETGKVLPK